MSERKLTLLHGRRGVLKRSRDVIGLQVGEVSENLLHGAPRRELTEDRRDRDPQATNAGHAAHLGRVDSDPLEVHRVRIREVWPLSAAGSCVKHRLVRARHRAGEFSVDLDDLAAVAPRRDGRVVTGAERDLRPRVAHLRP